MAEIILVTGGARSGKSALAERLAQSLGDRVIYIATSEPFDDEMQNRIDRHRARRDAGWRTLDAPLDLPDMLAQTDGDAPRLVDCLTMWLNNLIYHGRDVGDEMDRLIKAISEQGSDLVMVTNEIGSGLVPQTAEARRFRDMAGELNQMVAQTASQVYVSVSGIPVKIK